MRIVVAGAGKLGYSVAELLADDEFDVVIAQANLRLGENQEILDDLVVARHRGENIMARKEDIDFVDVSPKQIVSKTKISIGSIT